ncbi:MAG: ATP-binding protein [Anaerolineae bacterium]|jgi:signal transduction histidine kinase
MNIRTRLTLSHLAVIVVAMGLSGLLLLSLLERYFLQAMEDSLAAQARITAQALIPGAAAEGPPEEPPLSAYNTLQQQAWSNLAIEAENVSPPAENALGELDLNYLADVSVQLSTQLETRIRVLDTDGIVLVDSLGDAQGADLSHDPLVSQALTGQYASRAEPSTQAPAMHLALPVMVEGQLVGAVYLSQPLGDALAVVRDLRSLWLVSTAAALLLSGLVGLLLSGAITRPLRRLTVAAGAVARGDLDQQVPVRSGDEVGRLSQAFNDMTARLQAARQMQVDFVANVSHELRTPLTAVKGTVETLRDGAVDDPRVRDRFLTTVENETDRMIRLVNDLLTLSRADSEALHLRRERHSVVRLARAVVARYLALAEARDMVLRFEAGAGEAVALVDADRIEQVLVNLLDNALKYSRQGGTVTVAVDGTQRGEIQVRVQDEGIGIPAADLPRIGERFYRAAKDRSRARGGSGLGLAIARALVKAHGGRLWLESQEGRGTTVTFTLSPCP